MMPKVKQPPNPSVKTAMKNMAAKKDMPSDLGLLERTCPCGIQEARAKLVS